MKRVKAKKLQDRRRGGRSPYSRYGKSECLYSPAYYEWFRETTAKAHRLAKR